MKNALLIIFLTFSYTFLNAQVHHEGQCGTAPNENAVARLLTNKQAIRSNTHHRNDTTIFVPVQLHLVANDNGTGRMQERRAVQGLCRLNQDFADLDMVFYLTEDFNYIDMDEMYNLEFPGVPASVNTAYSTNKVPNALNIFVGNGLSSGNSGYYQPGIDIIYMDRTYMTLTSDIMSHETGHFFSLQHTFFGWESTTYDPSEPTPLTVTWGGFTNDVEYVNREINCETSGDYFCGTPADYITAGASNCNYTGGAVDPDSLLIDPDERNHMAYYSFSGCPQYHFAEDQKEVIREDFYSRIDLSELDCPEIKIVTETANLTSPINQDLVETFTSVDFAWEPVPNADFYLIEISPLPSFAFVLDEEVVTTNSFTSTVLGANRDNYYWRIWAFSQTDFCEVVYSESGHFATGDVDTKVQEIDFLEDISIVPNPILNQKATLHFDAKKSDAVHISISTASGQICQRIDDTIITPGKNTISLPTENLASGVYFVIIQSKNQISSKRLMIF